MVPKHPGSATRRIAKAPANGLRCGSALAAGRNDGGPAGLDTTTRSARAMRPLWWFTSHCGGLSPAVRRLGRIGAQAGARRFRWGAKPRRFAPYAQPPREPSARRTGPVDAVPGTARHPSPGGHECPRPAQALLPDHRGFPVFPTMAARSPGPQCQWVPLTGPSRRLRVPRGVLGLPVSNWRLRSRNIRVRPWPTGGAGQPSCRGSRDARIHGHPAGRPCGMSCHLSVRRSESA